MSSTEEQNTIVFTFYSRMQASVGEFLKQGNQFLREPYALGTVQIPKSDPVLVGLTLLPRKAGNREAERKGDPTAFPEVVRGCYESLSKQARAPCRNMNKRSRARRKCRRIHAKCNHLCEVLKICKTLCLAYGYTGTMKQTQGPVSPCGWGGWARRVTQGAPIPSPRPKGKEQGRKAGGMEGREEESGSKYGQVRR